MRKNLRLLLPFFLGLAAGLGGETLLILERQCWSAERALREDFRVLLFMGAEPEESRRKILEEKLLALPEVEGARYVSRAEALDALRREDPELVESATLLGEIPLNPAFEVRLAAGALGRISQWLSSAAGLSDWADIRYKSDQVSAIVSARFYGYLLSLVVGSNACAAALLALAFMWPLAWPASPHHRFQWSAAARPLRAAALAAGGALAGSLLVCALAWPMRVFSPWWAWPSASWQAVLLLGAGAAGGVFCGRGE